MCCWQGFCQSRVMLHDRTFQAPTIVGCVQEVMPLLEPFIYEWTMDQSGSISAEHGLGQMKNEAIHYSQSQHAIDTMRRLKVLFDPKNMLNPGKLLPSS